MKNENQKTEGNCKQSIKTRVQTALMTLSMMAMMFMVSSPNLWCEEEGSGMDGIGTSLVNLFTSIYGVVCIVATAAAILSAAVVLFFSLFSFEEKKILAARSLATKIGQTWVIILLLGAIFKFVDSTIITQFKGQ